VNSRSMALFLICTAVGATPCLAGPSLEDLEEGQRIHGFQALNLYLDGNDQPMGARFLSEETGFLVDFLRIQSVPQGFFWIKTPPSSHMGEPHACEHLLLGKGSRGRHVAALEDMSLAASSAYTSQLRTCYHFNTIAGIETFYTILEAKLMAFLHPDFTDEEIRREVCHLGVVENPDGTLSLEEKGTVYTEMVSAYERPWYHFSERMAAMVYGEEHPLTFSSGGNPADMRRMTPEDMWAFVERTHRLSNMGMIASLPDEVSLDSFLHTMSGILESAGGGSKAATEAGIRVSGLPAPDPAPEGTIGIVTYPNTNPQSHGYLLMQWPVVPAPDALDRMLLGFFMRAFAGTETSNLYNLFINSDTRTIDLGGSGLWAGVDDDYGVSPYVTFYGMNPAAMIEANLDRARSIVLEELARLASLEPGSAGLSQFNDQVSGLVTESRKSLNRTLNTPPGFGARGGPAGRWLRLLAETEEQEGFRTSLARNDLYDRVVALLDGSRNIWADLLREAGMLDTRPYVVGARPEPAMLAREAAAREERMTANVEDLMMRFRTSDPQEAIRRYREEFDAATAELEAIAAKDQIPGFMEDPPMTLDDVLRFEEFELTGGVRMVASTFDNMTSPYFGLAFDLNVTPEPWLVYLPVLPSLMLSTGVEMEGRILPYDEMIERLRGEVLSLNVGFDHGLETGRVELVVSGQGSDLEEFNRTLHWMETVLTSPYLDTANLPRILDILDHAIIGYRNRTMGSEEAWVSDPSNAYRFRKNPLFLSTNSFLTEAHHAWRVRWMLTDPGSGADREILASVFEALADEGPGRDITSLGLLLADLEDVIAGVRPATFPGADDVPDHVAARSGTASLMTAQEFEILSDAARDVLRYAARNMRTILADVTEETVAQDWEYLCRQVRADLLKSPSQTLDEIRSLLATIRSSPNARTFMSSSEADRRAATPRIAAFIRALDSGATPMRQDYGARDRILERLWEREPDAGRPVYAGLLFEGTQNGTLLFSARMAGRYDTDDGAITRSLSGKMYSGGGPHGIFMNTWAAGLAYSNGYSFSEAAGRVSYYAERCPDVAQTMKFVVKLLSDSAADPALAEYAIAQVFRHSRASSTYETRGRAMAADLADGITPDLAMREDPHLYSRLRARMEEAYGPVLIGYGPPLSESVDSNFFLIGPETQFLSLEQYISAAEGKDLPVRRLHPRDFWIRMDTAEGP